MIAVISKFFGGIKLWLYAAAAAAFASVIAYAKFEAHEKRKAQDAAQKAEQKAADAKTQLQHVETRDEVRTEVEKMPAPVADPQPVATAPSGSAAAELRDHWSQ